MSKNKILNDELRYKLMDNYYLKDDILEYDELREKNAKLGYQRQKLMKKLENMKEKREISLDVLACLKYLFYKSFKKLGYECTNPENLLIQPSQRNNGYQCTDAFKISQNLKKKLNGDKYIESPIKIAEKIIESLPENNIIETVTISGPGFINIELSKKLCSEFIADIILNENKLDLKMNPIKPPGFEKKKVIVDFSSPNIAKEMHVGHLRSTIIGDCICRLYEYLGCDVERINHIGDWGTQFGMLIAYIEKKFGSLHNISDNINIISDLQKFYKEAKILFDKDEIFKKTSYNYVVKLQSHDPIIISVWKMICDISRKEFNKLYKRLDIELKEMGESFYQNLMIETVDELSKKKLLITENNCQLIMMKELNLPPLFIIKSDGGFTYDTSDLAALKYRLNNMNGDCIFYVVDNGQNDHFKAIFHAAYLSNWYNKGSNYPRIEHIGFGVVLGEDKKKFKTRSGDTIKLSTLLDEGVERAKIKIKNKYINQNWSNEEIQSTSEALAYACIKYSDLSHHRTLDYIFSFDKMLEDKGNTAVYLLYALTRIKSILKKSNITNDNIKQFILNNIQNNNEYPIKYNHSSEILLVKQIIKYPIVIKRMANELLPHQLCDYIYDLATIFMDFYEKCYCFTLDNNKNISSINMDRISLTYATGNIFKSAFIILGINTDINRM